MFQAQFKTKKWRSTLVKPTKQTFDTKFNKDQVVVKYNDNEKKKNIKAVTISEFRHQHSKVTENFDGRKLLTDMFEEKGEFPVYYVTDIKIPKFPGRKPGISKIKSILNNISEITNVIQGVTTTYCYVGTEKTVAPFHTEDANLLSLNIMVEGKPKEWWFIPSSNSKKFEEFLNKRYQKNEVGCPNVASHKDIFPNPSELAKNNIDYYTFQQKPGDVVITAPNAYHGIINTGLNTNVAINFANLYWQNHFWFTKLSCTCKPDQSIATDLIDGLPVAKSFNKVEKYVAKQMLYLPNPEKSAELFKKVWDKSNPPLPLPPLQPLPPPPTLPSTSNGTAHQNDQKKQAKLSKEEWKNWYETLETPDTPSCKKKQPSKSNTRCLKCKKVFSDRHSFTKHYKRTCSNEGKPIPTPKTFRCSKCGKTFCEKRCLVWHQQEKLGCEYCEKFFLNKSNLNKHVKRFHTGVKY